MTMRKASVVVIPVLLSAAVSFWLGRTHSSRPTNADQGSIVGNVLIDRGSFSYSNAALSSIVLPNGSFAVDGDLHMRLLPDGKVALEGNLNVRPN
jgi:hypothetical protein